MSKQKIIDRWIEKNGAANFDLKGRNILLWDGGLFSIETKKVKRNKIVGFKKINEGKFKGCSEAIFSKKKYSDTDYYANLWFEELREIILYLQRMEKMLQKLGYKTDTSIKWQKRLRK